MALTTLNLAFQTFLHLCGTYTTLAFQEAVCGGLYDTFIEPWLKIFPRKQLYFVKFEDFITDKIGHLRKIIAFLELGNNEYILYMSFCVLFKSSDLHILSNPDYDCSINKLALPTLVERRVKLYKSFIEKIQNPEVGPQYRKI